MKCTHVCAAQNAYLLFTRFLKSDFPSLADEIAEPRPDMNIKVAAFTVSETSIYIHITASTVLKKSTFMFLSLSLY